MDYVVQEFDPGVALALVEGHLNGIGGECGGEDVGVGEFVPDVLAALGRGHHLDNDLGPFAFGYSRGLLLSADPLAIGGIGFSHSLLGAL